ncbi:GEgh16 protein [Colletotrichum abscissum]|uniref:GEgh16 protein n=1 Tax=Colletotrichum abscissum TaxID=1671311 RepID=A0A9P9XNA6_9PEZI|nr:GEgh16 protein [Colletotrichum abscissum]KAI3556626.1 GEgh16 protein [Colletotrichum abscissum]KAK1473546.1 GEgh16 protein [Colletotrichum abscissum]
MSSPMMRALAAAAMLAMAQAQGVILAAQGPNGPASPGLLVDANKADANIINQKEIVDNVVNECGRTILAGNIDIGETTEAQLGNNTVTKVTKGSNVDVTIAQVSADGAGPYSCDLDLTSNANGATGQTKLQVQEAGAQSGQIKLKVTMPDDLACVGASTGDVCTVRCFNDNAKGPFGGCFAVQQTDTKPKQNTPANIPTAQTLDGVLKQVQQNIVDLPAAVKSNQEAKTQDDQGVTAIKELLGNNATQQAAGPAGSGANTGNNNNNNGNNNNGNANAGNGNGRQKGKGNRNGNNNANNGGAAAGGNNANAGNNNANAGNNNANAGNNNANAGNTNANTGNTNANTGNTNANTGNNGGNGRTRGKNNNGGANTNAQNGGNNANANANANGNNNALPLATVGKGNGNRQNQQNGNNNKRDETPDAVLRTRWARRNLRRRAA